MSILTSQRLWVGIVIAVMAVTVVSGAAAQENSEEDMEGPPWTICGQVLYDTHEDHPPRAFGEGDATATIVSLDPFTQTRDGAQFTGMTNETGWFSIEVPDTTESLRFLLGPLYGFVDEGDEQDAFALSIAPHGATFDHPGDHTPDAVEGEDGWRVWTVEEAQERTKACEEDSPTSGDLEHRPGDQDHVGYTQVRWFDEDTEDPIVLPDGGLDAALTFNGQSLQDETADLWSEGAVKPPETGQDAPSSFFRVPLHMSGGFEVSLQENDYYPTEPETLTMEGDPWIQTVSLSRTVDTLDVTLEDDVTGVKLEDVRVEVCHGELFACQSSTTDVEDEDDEEAQPGVATFEDAPWSDATVGPYILTVDTGSLQNEYPGLYEDLGEDEVAVECHIDPGGSSCTVPIPSDTVGLTVDAVNHDFTNLTAPAQVKALYDGDEEASRSCDFPNEEACLLTVGKLHEGHDYEVVTEPDQPEEDRCEADEHHHARTSVHLQDDAAIVQPVPCLFNAIAHIGLVDAQAQATVAPSEVGDIRLCHEAGDVDFGCPGADVMAQQGAAIVSAHWQPCPVQECGLDRYDPDEDETDWRLEIDPSLAWRAAEDALDDVDLHDIVRGDVLERDLPLERATKTVTFAARDADGNPLDEDTEVETFEVTRGEDSFDCVEDATRSPFECTLDEEVPWDEQEPMTAEIRASTPTQPCIHNNTATLDLHRSWDPAQENPVLVNLSAPGPSLETVGLNDSHDGAILSGADVATGSVEIEAIHRDSEACKAPGEERSGEISGDGTEVTLTLTEGLSYDIEAEPKGVTTFYDDGKEENVKSSEPDKINITLDRADQEWEFDLEANDMHTNGALDGFTVTVREQDSEPCRGASIETLTADEAEEQVTVALQWGIARDLEVERTNHEVACIPGVQLDKHAPNLDTRTAELPRSAEEATVEITYPTFESPDLWIEVDADPLADCRAGSTYGNTSPVEGNDNCFYNVTNHDGGETQREIHFPWNGEDGAVEGYELRVIDRQEDGNVSDSEWIAFEPGDTIQVVLAANAYPVMAELATWETGDRGAIKDGLEPIAPQDELRLCAYDLHAKQDHVNLSGVLDEQDPEDADGSWEPVVCSPVSDQGTTTFENTTALPYAPAAEEDQARCHAYLLTTAEERWHPLDQVLYPLLVDEEWVGTVDIGPGEDCDDDQPQTAFNQQGLIDAASREACTAVEDAGLACSPGEGNATLYGIVDDSSTEAAVEGAVVCAVPLALDVNESDPAAPGEPCQMTNGTGEYTLEGMIPGTYKVTVLHQDHEAHQEDIEVEEETRLDVSLNARGTPEQCTGTGSMDGRVHHGEDPVRDNGVNAVVMATPTSVPGGCAIPGGLISGTTGTGHFSFTDMPEAMYELIALPLGTESTYLPGTAPCDVQEGAETTCNIQVEAAPGAGG